MSQQVAGSPPTHGQSHWAMSGMLAGCEDMPNPGPNGEETYVHIAKCGCDRPTEGGEAGGGAQALLVVTAPTNLTWRTVESGGRTAVPRHWGPMIQEKFGIKEAPDWWSEALSA